MKKRWKILTWGVVAAIPVALIIAFSISWTSKQQISCVGSSGVKPFIESFADDFIKDNSSYDITVDAGGSGYGISQVAESYTNIGNASKNPFSAVASQYQTEWEEKNIKTITVGWEAICIVYIPPTGLSSYDSDYLDSILTLDSSNIINLYRSFSGYMDGLDSAPTLGLFLSSNVTNESDKQILNNTQLIPYVRSGGSTTSGTAASFYDGSHFTNAHTGLTDQQINAFEGGSYGNDFKLYDTDEANSRAWDYFTHNDIPGSCVYLSSGFVEENIDLIRSYHYGIFAYTPEGESTPIPYEVSSIKAGYDFYRPLNIILSLNDDDSWKFADYLLYDTTDAKWNELGAQKVSEEDIESMEISGNIKVSDIELMTERGNSWTDKSTIFGAVD